MKKLTHIAAPVALTALLSACAVPGPEQMMQEASLYLDVQQALDNPGPGGLEQAVEQALADNPAPGNLSQSLQQALDNPGPGGLEQAVEQALADNPAPGNLSQAMQNFAQEGGMSQEAVQKEVQKAVNQALKEAQDPRYQPRYQQLEFVFQNMQGREYFVERLDGIFNDSEYISEDRKIALSRFGEGAFTYTLTDPWGIPEPTKNDIESRIRAAAASEEGIEIPVSWDNDPTPQRFLNDRLIYRSVAAKSNVTAGPVTDTCERSIKFTIDTSTLQAQGTTQVWVHDVQQQETKQVTDEYESDPLPGRIEDGECKVTEKASWYVMAFTTDTTPRVAEYHIVTASWKGSQVDPVTPERIRGEFIKGRPACPPNNWGQGYVEFREELGECGPL